VSALHAPWHFCSCTRVWRGLTSNSSSLLFSLRSFKQIIGHTNQLGVSNGAVVVQEYLEGKV
jgi:hypothetical protein